MFVCFENPNRDEFVEYKTVKMNSTNKMTMEALPIEVLTHILQFLSPIDRLRSERVCKRWRDASRYTWRDVKALYIISPYNYNYYYKFAGCFKSCELVEKEDNRLFVGSDSPKIIGCLISRVGCFIKKLIFDYRFSENYRVIFSDVNSYCRSLKIFEIESIFIVSDDKELFSRLFECNKELHSFRCTRSDHFIEVLPLRNWKSLCLGIGQAYHEMKIISLIEHSEALEEFEIENYTTSIVEALLKCRKLKSLHFKIERETSLEMIFDVPLLNRLTNLSIRPFNLDSPSLCNMLKHCYQLKRFEIIALYDDISVELLETISALPVLETLRIACSYMTDDMLIHLIKVRNLYLCDNETDPVTNDGILQMIKKSKILEKLSIKSTCVTPEMFEQLVGEMSNRPKYLEVMVPHKIFDEVSSICVGSKIRVVREMPCFRKWID